MYLNMCSILSDTTNTVCDKLGLHSEITQMCSKMVVLGVKLLTL